MNKKVLLITILMIVVIAAGVTLAWYSWASASNTLVSFNINGATVTYNASNITKKLVPTSSRTNEDNVIETITISATKDMYFTLGLGLTTLDSGLKHESFKYELYEGATQLISGNFSTLNQGDVITLLDRSTINTTTRTLTLYIWIDGNQSNSATMQNQNFLFNLRVNVTDQPPLLLANHIISLAETNTNQIRTVTHEAITTNTATGSTIPAVTDYRYYSADENADGIADSIDNYIYYNCTDPSDTDTCETWRIIGVFYDELTDTNRVKIISENIGNRAWDTRTSNGVNAWTATTGTPAVTSDATLNTYLNGNYYNSLSTSAKALIADATWYLGSLSSSALTVNAYLKERGNAVNTSDAYTRATSWNGKIGLMYPSDYGYAASNACVSGTALSSYSTSCKSTDWLYNSSYSNGQWTMSPYSGNSGSVVYVDSSGHVSTSNASYSGLAVRPVLYLISEAEFIDGDGKPGTPFVIK